MTIVDLTTNPPSRRTTWQSAPQRAASDRGLLQVSDLVIEYASGAQTSRPVDGLSFDAVPGTVTLLLGPSGCGKSSLLSCLGGLMKPTSGSIRLGDTAVHNLDRKAADQYRTSGVGMVFQSFELLPSLSAVENVSLVLRQAGASRKAAADRSVSLLTGLGLGDRLRHKPEQLSGGQQQRVAIARAIALDPMLVLADEPTAHLDHGSVLAVLDLHRRLADEGRIVLVSTHDDRMLAVASQVIEMSPRAAGQETLSAPGPLRLQEGEFLLRQGEPGLLVYVVTSGRLAVECRNPDGTSIQVAERGPGDYVGEVAPLFGLPRSASVKAIEPSVVEGMTVAEFHRRFGITDLTVNSRSQAQELSGQR